MKAFMTALVAFLFATSLFGQVLKINTHTVNGWIPIAWSDGLEEYISCIVDSASPADIYPNQKSTKSQMFRVKGTPGSWVEIEKEYEEEYTILSTLPIFRMDAVAPEGNGSGFAQIVISPTFALDSVYFPSINPVVDLWDRYWTPFLVSVSEEHYGKKFKKIRFRFTLQYADSGMIYVDNVGLGDVPDPLIDKMGEDTITSVVDVLDETPTQFTLHQNYPNPFNPETVIRYTLSVTGNVKLTVFNTLGQEVAVLVDEEKLPGSYEVVFNASNLPSGAYFYRLQTKNFVETKKMLLIK